MHEALAWLVLAIAEGAERGWRWLSARMEKELVDFHEWEEGPSVIMETESGERVEVCFTEISRRGMIQIKPVRFATAFFTAAEMRQLADQCDQVATELEERAKSALIGGAKGVEPLHAERP